MGILKMDSRRRITLPSKLVEGNEEFVAIKTREGILLKRLSPEDGLAILERLGKKLPKDKSTKELRREAEELALEEALDGIRRR